MAIWGEVSFKVKRAITFMERFTIGQLADMTGLDYQSVETVVQRLLKDGYIIQAEPRQPERGKRVGRPRQVYALVDDPEIEKKLYSSIEAFQIKEALTAASDRKPSSAHFDAAVSIIDSLEAGEKEISAVSLDEAAERLDFARRYEEMIEEGVEIAHAYTDFQQARLEFLRGDEDETKRLLAQARAVFQENGIDGQVKLVDDYEITITSKRQVSSALESASENRFGFALHQPHDGLHTLPSLFPSRPTRMRFLFSILIIWLFLFYNIERLSEPINLSSVAYTFVPIMAILTILVSPLCKVPLGVLLGGTIPIFLVFKALVGRPIWGAALPLTVMEICFIALTTILARWVSNAQSEFESVVAHITIGQVSKLLKPFSISQSEMYREVRRARHYQRPLMLMAIGVEKESIQVALHRMVQEVQQAMMKQYVLSSVAKSLCDELEDYNIIAQRGDHFFVLLPEVALENLTDLTKRLRRAVSEQVGVTLQIGTASFPEDAVTFESLVEKAVREMDAEPGVSPQSQKAAILGDVIYSKGS